MNNEQKIKSNFYLSYTDKTGEYKSKSDLFNIIRNNPYKSKINQLRLISDKKSDEYTFIKSSLPVCYWSVTFNNIDKSNKNISSLTSDFYFDIDTTSELNLIETKNTLMSIPFVKAVWTSVGGKGLGYLISTSGVNLINFKSFFKEIQTLMLNQYGIIIDKQCSNINRCNVVSSDEDLYVNEYSEIYEFNQIESIDEIFNDEDIKHTTNNNTSNNTLINYDLIVPTFYQTYQHNFKIDSKLGFVLFDSKQPYIKIDFFKNTNAGGRNKMIFMDLLRYVLINDGKQFVKIDYEFLLAGAEYINLRKCNELLSKSELQKIVLSVLRMYKSGDIKLTPELLSYRRLIIDFKSTVMINLADSLDIDLNTISGKKTLYNKILSMTLQNNINDTLKNNPNIKSAKELSELCNISLSTIYNYVDVKTVFKSNKLNEMEDYFNELKCQGNKITQQSFINSGKFNKKTVEKYYPNFKNEIKIYNSSL